MAMGESASDINKNKELKENSITDLKHEFNIAYRLLRKKFSSLIRAGLNKNFSNILYITAESIPYELITGLQRQYPDKIIQVLIPIFEEDKNLYKPIITFDYILQNKKHTANIFSVPSIINGIKIYGVYTKKFSEIKNYKDIYNIKYLSHFTKIARKTALKIKPDLIHADNIPLLLGLEYGNRLKNGYPIKYVQAIHDISMFEEIEPFWASINLVNKNEMKRICKDEGIQKLLASLFKIEYNKKFKKCRGCLNYLYKHYDEYRDNISVEESTRENAIFKRLNERIIKLFPNAVKNSSSYSLKKARGKIINSMPDYELKDYIFLIKKSDKISDDKIKHSFDITNFREVRELNKKYLVREFSEKRIETKFIDLTLFTSDEINIKGYLDSFYKAPLLFIPFNEYTKDDDIKKVSIAILKLFELRKNIQVIYNYPKNLKSTYLKALLEFFSSQPALNGRWLALEGILNLAQFVSASDFTLMPSGNFLNSEKILYKALQYGSIPVVDSRSVCSNIVTDIYSDMNTGFGFISEKVNFDENYIEKQRNAYTNTLLKALDFMNNNKSGWNILIHNAMNYDSSWDFATIEKYNNLYDEFLL